MVQSERTLDLRWPGRHAPAHQKPAIRDTVPVPMFHSLHNNVQHNVNDDFKSNLTNKKMLNADDVSDDEGGVLDHLLGSPVEDSDEDRNDELDVDGNENGTTEVENVVQENENVDTEDASRKGKEAAEEPSRAPSQATGMEALQNYAEATRDMREGRPQPTDFQLGRGVYWCSTRKIGFIQGDDGQRHFVNSVDIAPNEGDAYREKIISLFNNQARSEQVMLQFRRKAYWNKKQGKWLTKCIDVDMVWREGSQQEGAMVGIGRRIEIEDDNATQMSRQPTVGDKRKVGDVMHVKEMDKKVKEGDGMIPPKAPRTVPRKPRKMASLMLAYNQDALQNVGQLSHELQCKKALKLVWNNETLKNEFLTNIDPLKRLGMTSKRMNAKCEMMVGNILLTSIRDCDPFERPDIQRMAQDKVKHGNESLFSTWVLLECIRERQAWVEQGILSDMENAILEVPYDDTFKKIKFIVLKWAGNRQNMCTLKMVFREIDLFVEGMAMRGELYDSSTPQALLKRTWDDTVDLLLLFAEYVFKTGSEEFEFDDWFANARVGDLGAFYPGDWMTTPDEDVHLKKFKPFVFDLQPGRLVFDDGNAKKQERISPKGMWMQKLQSWSYKLLLSLFDMIKMTKKANTPRMTKAWCHKDRVAQYFKLTQMILVTRLFGEEIGLVCVHVLGCMVEQYPQSLNLLERKKKDLQDSLMKKSSGDMEEDDQHSYTYAWGMRASKMILDMMRDYNFHKKTEQWIVLMEALRKIDKASRSLGRAPYFKFGK